MLAKRTNCEAANEKSKCAVVVQYVRIARNSRLEYDDFLNISQQARKKLDLRRAPQEQRRPQLLAYTDAGLTAESSESAWFE